MSDSPRILLLNEARAAGLTRAVSIRVPVARVEMELRPMLADLLRAHVPAALVHVAGEGAAAMVAIHRLPPVKKRLRPSWDFAKDSIGPAPVIGKRRNNQTNLNHA